jgi:hypothetical protein
MRRKPPSGEAHGASQTSRLASGTGAARAAAPTSARGPARAEGVAAPPAGKRLAVIAPVRRLHGCVSRRGLGLEVTLVERWPARRRLPNALHPVEGTAGAARHRGQ